MNPLVPAIDPDVLTTQRWDDYTEEDHEVWSILFRRRMEDLDVHGSRVFLDGAERIGLRADSVPDLEHVNRALFPRTGWCAVPVRGFIPAGQFFASIAERRFPTTIAVRSKAQLDYLPEPDIFHDVFGHVPLHAHPMFADFLQRFGRVAARARSQEEVRRMARLFWFTVEFGLIREDGAIKVYGSGLISSHEDCANALGRGCDRRPFDLEAVMAREFAIDRLQEVLFVVDSFEQLFAAVEDASLEVGG